MPASRGDVKRAAGFLITATEMGLPEKQRASDGEKQTFIRMLASFDYTRAELMLAMREVPRDPERFGGRGVTMQDVERVVAKSRKARRRLQQQVTAQQAGDLCAEHAEIEMDDFQCCGFDGYNNPLYRYAPNVQRHAGPPRAELSEPERPGQHRQRDGDEHEAKRLGDVLPVKGRDSKEAA